MVDPPFFVQLCQLSVPGPPVVRNIQDAIRNFLNRDLISRDFMTFPEYYSKLDVVVFVNADAGRPVGQHKEDRTRQNQD